MPIKQFDTMFRFTLLSLLSIWAAFGSFELAEAIELLDEIVTEDATHQDLDEQSLVQLASSIKSEMPMLDDARGATSPVTLIPAIPSSPAARPQQPTDLAGHGPPSLPLYQQFSVYRI